MENSQSNNDRKEVHKQSRSQELQTNQPYQQHPENNRENGQNSPRQTPRGQQNH
jgi:hypothetical protein